MHFLHNACYCSNNTEVKPLDGTMSHGHGIDSILIVLFLGGGALLQRHVCLERKELQASWIGWY